MNFENLTIRINVTTRGGGIEIALDSFGFENEKMTAYQNYLGGGMLGRVANDCTVKDWTENEKLNEVAENLRKYFFLLTNPEQDEFESLSYKQNQSLSISAY